MAINHMDNFDVYGTNVNLLTQGIYAAIGANAALVNDPNGGSNRVIRGSNTNEHFRYASSIGATPKLGMAFRMWQASLPANDGNGAGARVLNAAGDDLCTLQVLPNGGLRVTMRDSTNTQIVTDYTVPVLTANAWWHIELMYHRTGTNTADFEVRVEGVTVVNQAGVSCRAFDPALLAWGAFGSGTNTINRYCKDLVCWDGTGANNTSFLGSVLVAKLVPTADVALNWTPSTGATGWSILDNNPPNDAQYISANDPPPAAYVAALSDLPIDVTSVKALMSLVRAAKIDGGDGNLQVSMISNGDTGDGANRPITITQTYWRDVFEVDPDTAAPWLPAAVNAANLKINRTT